MPKLTPAVHTVSSFYLADKTMNIIITFCFILLIFLPYARSIPESSPLYEFTSSGKVAQLEYASKSVEKASPRFCFTNEILDCAFFVCFVPPRLRLSENTPNQAIHRFHDAGLICLPAGYNPDVMKAVSEVNSIIQRSYLQFGAPPTTEKISHDISRWITRGLYASKDKNSGSGPARPLATSIAIVAKDNSARKNRLVQIDCTGLVTYRRLALFGRVPHYARRQIISNVLAQQSAGDQETTNRDGLNGLEEARHDFLKAIGKSLKLLADKDLVMECALIDNSGRIHHRENIREVCDVLAWVDSRIMESLSL